MDSIIYLALTQEPSSMPTDLSLVHPTGAPATLTYGLLAWMVLKELIPAVRAIMDAFAKRIQTPAPVVVQESGNGKMVDHELSLRITAIEDAHRQLCGRVSAVTAQVADVATDLRRHLEKSGNPPEAAG